MLTTSIPSYQVIECELWFQRQSGACSIAPFTSLTNGPNNIPRLEHLQNNWKITYFYSDPTNQADFISPEVHYLWLVTSWISRIIMLWRTIDCQKGLCCKINYMSQTSAHTIKVSIDKPKSDIIHVPDVKDHPIPVFFAVSVHFRFDALFHIIHPIYSHKMLVEYKSY